jgi:thymidylate synthase
VDEVSSWPIEYADQMIIGDINFDVAVCCLWSDRRSIAGQLSGCPYVVIGNLYSRAGINSILRNIFANPRIRYLVVVGTSRTDSHAALLNFFQLGIDDNGHIKNNGGRIDSEFPRNSLEKLRNAVAAVDLTDAAPLADTYRRFLADRAVRGPFTSARVYEAPSYKAEVLPSEQNGFIVRAATIIDAWTDVLALIMKYGSVTPTDYGTPQRELLNLVSVVAQPSPTIPQLPSWADFDVTHVSRYVEGFFESAPDPGTAYTYGDRLQTHFGVNQLAAMRAELTRAGFSRRALASLWDPVCDSTSDNPPCIAVIQANIRQNELSITSFVRSHDMFRAYPLNAVALAALQTRLCEGIGGIRVGALVFLSQSAHIYSDCWARALHASTFSARSFTQDMRGSFVFYREGNLLIADHYDMQGDLLQRLSSDSAVTLLRLVTPLVSRVDHALYIGREIQRLDAARRENKRYEQDRVD